MLKLIVYVKCIFDGDSPYRTVFISRAIYGPKSARKGMYNIKINIKYMISILSTLSVHCPRYQYTPWPKITL